MNCRAYRSLFLVICFCVSFCTPETVTQSGSPIGLRTFRHLMATLSEPEGFFDSDNFVSNEGAYLKILPALKNLGVQGGAYLGVGPDQNYSYIAAIRPSLAIIADIRRQNALQHLYFKSLFQLSSTRAQYLARLFGRRINASPERTKNSNISELLILIDRAPQDQTFEQINELEANRVVRSWDLGLRDADFEVIQRIAHAFVEGGPDLKFTSYHRAPRSYHPTYRRLLEETDSQKVQSNYLADEEKFQFIKNLHSQNRIVPIVGDLAGSFAIRRTAAELRRRKLTITCLYVSNVERYLFGGERWQTYIQNLNLLPREANACLIRSYANRWKQYPAPNARYYMSTALELLSTFLEEESLGTHKTYWDVIGGGYSGY